MYSLEITPAEWELVYRVARASSTDWANALIDSPLWGDGPSEISIEYAIPLDEAFRTEQNNGLPTFPGLDSNTLLFFKLNQFCTDLELDMVELENA